MTKELIIKQVSPTSVRVGNKIVFNNGHTWQAVTNLSPTEKKAFHQYITNNNINV